MGATLSKKKDEEEDFRQSGALIVLNKGIARLKSATRFIAVNEWRSNRNYSAGSIAYFDNIRGGNWAMCMKQHISNTENKPTKNDIFADLLIDIVPQIEAILNKYVYGFNTMLSSVILDYAYNTSEFWWNGCEGTYDSNHQWIEYICGNLIMNGWSGNLCKKCKNLQILKTNNNTLFSLLKTRRKQINTNDISHNNNCGAVINFDKDTGKITRSILNTDQDKSNKRCLIFNTNVILSPQKQKICNLLKRNFNKSMENLINKCCISNTKVSITVNNNKIEIGNVNIWGLYADRNQTELLCALVWRSVGGKIKQTVYPFGALAITTTEIKNVLMFEVLFLSTSEHVRHEKYGKQMVNKINNYAISNCYDIISVAAVPNHGMSFWKSNGFVMKYDVSQVMENTPKKEVSDELDTSATPWKTFMKNNMLVFNDTPLFGKFLT